jgi:hypothetical protein
LVERDLTGFGQGWKTFDDTVVASRPGRDFLSWDGGWREESDETPDGTIVGLAGSLEGSLFVYGFNEDGVGAIWQFDAGRWVSADWLYEPAPELVEDAGAGDEMVDELVFEDAAAPSPMVGVVAEAAIPGVPLPSEIRHLDVRPDGRAVAVSADQVWWRMDAGWRLVHRSDAPILAGFVDAGETWVIVTEAGLQRCWRDQCEEAGVPSPAGGPDSVEALVVDGGGWAVVDTAGHLHQFVPAEIASSEVLTEPAIETPVGSWQQSGSVGRYASRITSYHRRGEVEIFLTDSGELFEREGEDWVLQAESLSLLGVLPVADSWGVLTERGLFQLGSVRPVVREIEPDAEASQE